MVLLVETPGPAGMTPRWWSDTTITRWLSEDSLTVPGVTVDAVHHGAMTESGVPRRRALVVDDETALAEVVGSYLAREGFEVHVARDGAQALSQMREVDPDVVVLDVGLPGIDGFEVCRQLRLFSDAYVVMLTARDTEVDTVVGLSVGADDYVTKPFSPRELILRVQAVLRRGRGAATTTRRSFGGGELIIDEDRREVIVREKPLELTPSEWGVLTTLARSPGRVYSRFDLINRVRGYEYDGYERSVDSHVKNLRRKVERNPHDPRIVQTVLGAGYRLGLSRDE